MEQYLQNFKKCLQKEIPFCAAECPFYIDIHDFIEKMKRGSFKGAFKTYRAAVGFPVIAANLCHAPCKEVCPRKDWDASIELNLLEKACVSCAKDRSPVDYNLPQKQKKVAIIGAGISGLACALRLCMKKYEVEVFEEKDRIGGALWDLMEPELFLADIEEQFLYENYVLHLNTPVRSIEDLETMGFDAVYVATGEKGEDFGLLSITGNEENDNAEVPAAKTGDAGNRYCARYGRTGWFAGGGLIGEKAVYALAGGLRMGTVIDNFLKTGNLLYPLNEQSTAMCLDPSKQKYKEPIVPKDGKGFTEEEAIREAARCLECRCDFCRTYCDLTDFYNKWPLRIRDEIMATTLPGSADIKATPAKRLLSTCNQCGLCKETCPEEIDLGGLILEGRKSMHRQKKAPWVFHDFWLRDMDFADSELAAVAKLSPKSDAADGAKAGPAHCKDTGNGELRESACSYAFFPGCQLGASDPGLVEKAYSYLLGRRPDTGLLLRCCGAPAEWSGDEEKHKNKLGEIRSLWAELGRPKLILACPTCLKKFKTYLSEIPVISLYEIMAAWGIDARGTDSGLSGAGAEQKTANSEQGPETIYSVFDACAARYEGSMKESVRRLAEAAGYSLQSLPEQELNSSCCSFGGQPGIANPEYAEFVVQKRISESENPYITYCINCRDVFLESGKASVHILDVVFKEGKAPAKLATVSQRRENRIKLKKELLGRYWSDDMAEDMPESSGTQSMNDSLPGSSTSRKYLEFRKMVFVPEELSQKLSQKRILEKDIISVVEFCERTGRRVFHPEKESYSGYRQIGYATYWVEYKVIGLEGSVQKTESNMQKPGAEYELINAYAHRVKIELETVWNGKKTEAEQ